MSLKTDLAARGVKLADLAKELEEAYGNLYTALSMEHQGKEIRHKAVLARVAKVREWLDRSAADEERVSASVEAVGNRAALLKRVTRNMPAGWTLREALAGDRAVETGDVLTMMEEGVAVRYRLLKVVTNTAGSTWADVFGPLPKSEKDEAPKVRSLRLERLGLTVVACTP